MGLSPALIRLRTKLECQCHAAWHPGCQLEMPPTPVPQSPSASLITVDHLPRYYLSALLTGTELCRLLPRHQGRKYFKWRFGAEGLSSSSLSPAFLLPGSIEPPNCLPNIDRETNLVALHGVATQSSTWQPGDIMKQLHHATWIDPPRTGIFHRQAAR